MKRHHRFGLGAIFVLALLLTAPASIAHQGDRDDAGQVPYECTTHLDVHLQQLAEVDSDHQPTTARQRVDALKMQIANIVRAIRLAKEMHEAAEWCIRILTGGDGS